MSTQMVIRIEPELKAKIERLAKNEGKTTSTVVRGLIEEYVQDRDIGGYIDGLWERIGNTLKTQGVTPAKIRRAIKSVRKSK